MKWAKPDGGVQWTVDRRFCIVNATETGPIWIAYEMGPTTGIPLGRDSSDELARQLCEDHERYLEAQRKRA